MPRPRSTSDQQILEATARTVGRLGPGRLTLAAVAKDAGLSPATLVQRFGSKRGLLLAFARHGGSLLGEAFAAARSRHESAIDALMEVALGQTRLMRTPEMLANHVAFLQMDLNDPEFRALALAGSRRARRELRSLLDDAVGRGELVPCDTRALGRAVQALFNGSIVFWAIHREGTAARWVRRDLETLLAPLRARRAPRPDRSAGKERRRS